MIMHFVKRSLGLFISLSLASGAALAGELVQGGSFSVSGTVYVSSTALDFSYGTYPPPGDQHASVNLTQNGGAFSYLAAGTLVDMYNFTLPNSVGASAINFGTSMPVFVTLPPNATGTAIDLSLTSIPISIVVPLCSSVSNLDTEGTACRAYASSPIVLEQGVSGVTAILNLHGNVYYAGSTPSAGTTYDGEFSADFTGADGTISGLLNSFASQGDVITGFTANFSAVPEPGTVTVLGAGLLAIGFINKKKRAARKEEKNRKERADPNAPPAAVRTR